MLYRQLILSDKGIIILFYGHYRFFTSSILPVATKFTNKLFLTLLDMVSTALYSFLGWLGGKALSLSMALLHAVRKVTPSHHNVGEEILRWSC